MKRAFVAAVLAASLISIVAVAAVAQSAPQWSRQPENGFRTFPPVAAANGQDVLEGAAAGDANSASPTQTSTPDPTATASQTPQAELGQAIVAAATATAPPTPRPTPVRTPAPAPVRAPAAPAPILVPTVAQAKAYALSVIGSTQYSCLLPLWQRESNWNPTARNSSSGAYGIPQALPGYKMAVYGSDWQYDPVTQVKWGLSYIRSRYGSACGAWSYWQSHGWY